MIRTTSVLGAIALGVFTGCASYPMPAQHMADAEAATRSAQDLGAATSPQGQLHLKLAQEEIARAKQQMADGDNERADYTLVRAKSDAELAVAEAKGTIAQNEAAKATQTVSELRSQFAGPQPTSVTTTTSATTTPSPTPAPGSTTTSTTTTSTGGQK